MDYNAELDDPGNYYECYERRKNPGANGQCLYHFMCRMSVVNPWHWEQLDGYLNSGRGKKLILWCGK